MASCLITQTILKASSEPNNSSSLVPFTIFDKASFNLRFAVLYAFKPPMPSNEVLKSTLSEALSHFPQLAGRFTTNEVGEKCILLNNGGIRLIEAHVPTPLADELPFDPSIDLTHLFPPTEGVDELLQIQLNRYTCGGLVIGLTTHHWVADGLSMSSFFVVWDRLVRGLDIDLLPCLDRASIIVPRVEPKVEFNHHLIEFRELASTVQETPNLSPIQELSAHYSVNFLNKLKPKVMSESSPYQRFSTFECLLAHVWKRVTQCRGLELEEYTQVKVAVDGRTRIKPQVPPEYFGNLVLWAYPRLTVREVLTESHAYVARAIHDAVAKVDDRYFKSFIDFGEISKNSGVELEGTEPKPGSNLCPDMRVASWMGLQFHELDFGGGGLCAILFPGLSAEGMVMFLPSCKEGGAVDVVMSLWPEQAHLFKQICHSLEFSGWKTHMHSPNSKI